MKGEILILKFNDVVMQRILRHLCLRIAGFHLQLNFPSQSAHAIEFVDRISCAGNDGPSHHHKCDSHHSNFFLNAVAGHRKPGPKLARVLFTSAWGWDMLGPHILHFIAYPAGTISAQEQRQQQQSQEPTALQLHGSLSHKKHYELTQVPSLNEVSCSSWKINSGRVNTQ